MANLSEIYAELRTRIEAAGSQKAWAQQAGISGAYLNDVLMARRDPGPKILAALGYVRRVTYHRSNRT